MRLSYKENISLVFMLLVSLMHDAHSINSRFRDHVELNSVLLMPSQRVHLLALFCLKT